MVKILDYTLRNGGGKSIKEQSEEIEILRFFEHNKRERFVEISAKSLAINSPADIEKVVNKLKR